MTFNIIIPARMESARLPGKVLQDIGGKPMVQHVYELAQSTSADMVCVATDSEQVAEVARGFGAPVCMTATSHLTGSERVAEAADNLHLEDDEIVICLQADEPQMPASVIESVATAMQANETIKVASVCHRVESPEELFDPGVVKVVLNQRNNATYFSRAPIPWCRDEFKMGVIPEQLLGDYYRHIGLYGYRVDFLQRYLSWGPSPAEQMESLEQLRILWNGGRIHMVKTDDHVPAGIDTPADLERIRAEWVK